METKADNTKVDAGAGGIGSGVALQPPQNTAPAQGIEVKGRFNRYTSGYWALALPALSVRYAFEAITDLGTKLGNGHVKWTEKMEKTYALGVGSFMMALTTFYAYRTYRDMRNMFAEPLAWEFDKKPEDIGFTDMMRSKNVLLQDLRKRFFSYNAGRVAVNSVFFSSFLPTRMAPTHDAAVKLGVASNALYLMTDVMGRKETFFERLQTFTDRNINHVDDVGELITANDLMGLYYLHEREMHSDYRPPQMSSQQWRDDNAYFSRIADLMNQTYGNTEVREHADYTITKFIYMMGMGLMEAGNKARSLAYVEMANRDGIPAVKQAMRGQIELFPAETEKKEHAASPAPVPETILPNVEKTFSSQVAANPLQSGLKDIFDKKKQNVAGTFTEKLACESHASERDPLTPL